MFSLETLTKFRTAFRIPAIGGGSRFRTAGSLLQPVDRFPKKSEGCTWSMSSAYFGEVNNT